jgi:uncharacterized glyoxalase superfamily protein PhnB
VPAGPRFIERDWWSNDDGAVTNVELTLGGAEVWLDGPVSDWPQRLEGLGSWIGLQVDDLDAVHAHLRDLGVAVEPPVDRGFWTRHLTVVDPEGHECVYGTRPPEQRRQRSQSLLLPRFAARHGTRCQHTLYVRDSTVDGDSELLPPVGFGQRRFRQPPTPLRAGRLHYERAQGKNHCVMGFTVAPG